MLIRKSRCRRSGATTIETALVVIPTLMLLFGVFEYGRLLMDWNVLNNAAREGCRYALANNTSTTISTDVSTLVTTKMGARSTVSAFHGDGQRNANGTTYTGNNVNNLAAGDLITVTVVAHTFS